MREIKFRAWDKNQGEFIGEWDTGEYSPIEFDGDSVRVIQHTLVDAIVDGEHDQHEDYISITEGIEVMQFTGLKDKNGVEIYEGDIVKTGQIKSADDPVEWRAAIEFHKGSFIADGDLLRDSEKYQFEVIGNIHESPELLP